jgi:hypothetical protein
MTNRQSDVTAGPGGVMTDEVGVVTGDLTVRTGVDDAGALRCQVQYQGADEWYLITGAPTRLAGDTDLDAVHASVVQRVTHGDG